MTGRTVNRWAVLAVLCASLLLVAMDATILNVALPSLIDDLDPDAYEQLWIIDIYGLVLGGLLITAGAAGDRWGRKTFFLVGFVLFGAASIVSATADSPGRLIAGRVLLAVGGAMVMPSTLSLIRNVFTDPRERGTAIGVWASVAGAGAAIGPVLGGLLVEHYGWSAAFWVNVPVVVATVVFGWRLLPESRSPGRTRLDWFGAAQSVFGMISLVWGIKHLAKDGLASSAPVALLAGAGLLAWFAWRQLRQTDPLLDVRLFTNRPFLAGAIATLMAMMAVGAAYFLISLWLQYVHGYSPVEAGVRMLPGALATLVGALSAPWLVRRVGVHTMLALGLGALVVAFVALATLPLTYGVAALALVAFGLGDGLAITTTTAVMISAAPPERAGSAAAVEETCYELGIGFGVALLGTIAAVLYASGVHELPLSEPGRTAVEESIGGAVHVARTQGAQVSGYLLEVARSAYEHALAVTSAISAALIAAATLLALALIPRGFRADAEH
ncbi:MAG: MFS transporter [Hamadaea sp.]|uniref:MFS transporter n=1 Tax=Hamadaea sp. TaxID=2024425 RepID=UPI0017AE659B|nr:MFS transporter [Hamadaea sp.]NUR72209.1 MFS transporter [Hamadaea sp.]NUT22102.1 MFS transporter [Hamadaea sp.]